jgi:NarL family two-component system response regulator LiaR
MNPILVLLADDHPVVRSGIRALLAKADDLEIVAEAASGAETMELAGKFSPHVVLLDLELPDIEGIQVARQIQKLYPDIKILALSAHDDPFYIKGVLESDAAGYLLKDEAPEMILDAIRGVARGDKGWVSRRISAQIATWVRDGKPSEARLTQREEDVLRLVVDGKTNQAIAAELQISEKTVEKYMGTIFTKLNVTSRVEAAVHAVRQGLVRQE